MSLPPLFAPQSTPRVFATPPGVDAAHALATGFRVRLGEGPPERWARCTVYLNAQRSAKAFARALRTGPAHLLPRLLTIDGLAAQQGLFAAQTPLARTLDLTALVAKLLEADPSLGVAQNAFDLAESLSALLDEMAVEGVTVAQLRTLPPDALQQHWQKSLAFLDLVTGQEARLGLGEASSVLQARAVAQQIEAWAASPPDQPVLAAGSTASRRPTADLLAAIAHLPQGAVILPGLDRTLPLDAVDQLVEAQSPTLDHPQAMMVRFLDRLGLRPSEVPLWGETALEGAPRQALISLALRPAPVTDGWLRDGPALRDTLGPATAKISLVEAPTQQAEADTLAWAIRSALHRGKTVALVSADRGLTRRVQAALLRWQIEADDSAGRPLQQTPPGVFLRLVLSALDGAPAPAILAALLKHPITATGALAESGTAEDADSTRSTHLKRVERFEHGVLRAGLPTLSLDALPSDWIEGSGDQAWLAWLRRALTPGPPDEGAQDRWQRHMQAAQQLAHGPDGGGGHQEEAPSGALWQQAAGRRCRDVFYGLGDALEGRAPGLGALYPHILRAVLGGAEVADRASNAHPSLAILGPREARMESADVMILAGLNEDVWPRQPNPDAWLSRGMRAALGLTVPERQLGLAAHDFQQGTTGSELVLSRAVRDASAPTVPSRWLMRLTNLLSGLGETGTDALAQMRARGSTLGAMAKALAPPRATPRATRPQPCPPAEARPARLSVTRVEALIRDPYAIYAAYVLGLRALDPLSRDADALLRGTAFHTVLQRFVEATRAGLPPGDQALALWDQTVAQTLAEQVPWRAERVFWTSRLSRAGPAFLASEADRRALGTPLVLEVMGTRAMADGRFTLSATADRIDRMPDGQLALYDYKSGDPPSDEALRTSSIQILLEAGIAAVGGFSGAPAATTGYAQIIGLKPEGKIREVPLDLAEDWPKVENLIAQVLNPAWPMTARLRPGQVVDHTYDHLSRLGEWEDGD